MQEVGVIHEEPDLCMHPSRLGSYSVCIALQLQIIWYLSSNQWQFWCCYNAACKIGSHCVWQSN